MGGQDMDFTQQWQRWCEEHAGTLPLAIECFRIGGSGTLELKLRDAHPALRFWAFGIGLGVDVITPNMDYCIYHSFAGTCGTGGGLYGFGITGDLCGSDYASIESFWELVFQSWATFVSQLLRPGVWLAQASSTKWKITKEPTQFAIFLSRVKLNRLRYDNAFPTRLEAVDW